MTTSDLFILAIIAVLAGGGACVFYECSGPEDVPVPVEAVGERGDLNGGDLILAPGVGTKWIVVE